LPALFGGVGVDNQLSPPPELPASAGGPLLPPLPAPLLPPLLDPLLLPEPPDDPLPLPLEPPLASAPLAPLSGALPADVAQPIE
jgi:hypothetical protein